MLHNLQRLQCYLRRVRAYDARVNQTSKVASPGMVFVEVDVQSTARPLQTYAFQPSFDSLHHLIAVRCPIRGCHWVNTGRWNTTSVPDGGLKPT